MKTVLVVEDTEDLRDLFVEVLRSAGYRVVCAENGQHALEVLATMNDEPCLVLLDMMMPIMDGRMFLQQLHDNHRVAALPIVVTSAVVGNGQAVAGARKVVRKPISPKMLTELVHEFCGPAAG